MKELFREFVVAKTKREDERDRDMSLAWHTAALIRGTKGLPKLEQLLVKKRRQPRQTGREQVAMWQIAAARFGGAFRPLDPNTVIVNG